jgi:hypothetical protein
MVTERQAKRIRAYIEKLDPAMAGQRGHDTTFHAACVLVKRFGLSPEDAWPFILEYNARCMPPWSERDLRRKLQQALAKPGDKPRGYLLGEKMVSQSIEMPAPIPRPTKPAYQPEKLTKLASRVSDGITPQYLEARSKFTCWNRSPAGVLHKLYYPGEKVVVFNIFESQGCEVWEHKGNGQDLSTLDYLARGQRQGVWFLANPVHGEYVYQDRLKSETNPEGKSRRCEECITSWRYLLLESDKAPKDVWLRALVQMPLRIAAIYDSGGKSIHALVRIDADSKKHWDDVRALFLPSLVRHGACDGSLSAVRLTRLPNCVRGRQWQTLLYLNDAPERIPICEIPVREDPEITRKRWGSTRFATTWEKIDVT